MKIPSSYRWTKPADEILASVKRFWQKSERQLHNRLSSTCSYSHRVRRLNSSELRCMQLTWLAEARPFQEVERLSRAAAQQYPRPAEW